MAKYKVTAPDKQFNGVVGGVQFVAGRADMDGATDRAALSYCRRRGYAVERVDEQPKRAASSRSKKSDE